MSAAATPMNIGAGGAPPGPCPEITARTEVRLTLPVAP